MLGAKHGETGEHAWQSGVNSPAPWILGLLMRCGRRPRGCNRLAPCLGCQRRLRREAKGGGAWWLQPLPQGEEPEQVKGSRAEGCLPPIRLCIVAW